MVEVQESQTQPLGEYGENEVITESSAFVKGEHLHEQTSVPKVDSAVEALHEKVTKQIIKEGHGQKPSKYSTCFFHYRASTESTQDKFEDTWHEKQPIELVLGKEKKEMNGFGIVVASMKAGERALLRVGCELGCGKGWKLFFSKCSAYDRFSL